MPRITNVLHRFFPVLGAVQEKSLPAHDVTAFASEFDLAPMQVIQDAPVWMTRAERLLMYTLAFTLRPSRYLEIGTFQGGSALVVGAALDALQSESQMVCVDPKWNVAPENWEKIKHRATFIEGYSPDVLPKAVEAAKGKFDLVLIDGDHTYKGVLRDARGVLPHITKNAYILFHDSYFPDVARGLNQFANENAHQLVDFGTLTREITVHENEDNPNQKTRWGGLRMMQMRQS
ncbi:MAG: class I SAM-dependent methyltransferase [Candidatus Promineifilaceae bacterium]|nr:class I SAM-dependent methyltransferase [Anaerolineaceae bacterium]